MNSDVFSARPRNSLFLCKIFMIIQKSITSIFKMTFDQKEHNLYKILYFDDKNTSKYEIKIST